MGEPAASGWAFRGVTPGNRRRKLSGELANGCLAMISIIGMLFRDGLTGSAWGDWPNFIDSSLTAETFESDLGAQPPVGFWDPAGTCSFGGKSDFHWRRCTEITHGRFSILACIGYMVPEYFRWPGGSSCLNGLTFEQVPGGLAAAAKVPTAGRLRIFSLYGYQEPANFKGSGEPGSFGWGFPGVTSGNRQNELSPE